MVWWNAIAGFAQGVIGSRAFRAQARANNMLSEVNAEAKNKVRTAQNAEVAAHNNLARWIQSVNNNRTLDAGGDALEEGIVNYRRGEDAALTQGFSNSVRSAEAEGAAAAAAALNGVDGNVVDMVNSSMALRDSIVDQQFQDYRDMNNYDTARRAGSIMSQMVSGLDNSIIMDTLDYNVDVSQREVEYSTLQYGLFGMIQHMGGVGDDPAPKDDKKANKERLDANERKAQEMADRQREDTEKSKTMDSNPQAQGRFMFKYGMDNDQEYNPYSLWNSDRSGAAYGSDERRGDDYSAW